MRFSRHDAERLRGPSGGDDEAAHARLANPLVHNRGRCSECLRAEGLDATMLMFVRICEPGDRRKEDSLSFKAKFGTVGITCTPREARSDEPWPCHRFGGR